MDQRVSDVERQAAAERLRSAVDDGSLDLLEYDARTAQAYRAVTRSELDRLLVDLPAQRRSGRPSGAGRGARPSSGLTAALLDEPVPLRVLWAVWSLAVTVNLTVWVLVSLGEGDAPYFWPMWLLVPGVLLLGVSRGLALLRS